MEVSVYRKRLKELAQEVLQDGLQSVEALQNAVLNAQAYIRYATGESLREVRETQQAVLDISKAQLEAHRTGSLNEIAAIAKPDAPHQVAAPPEPAIKQEKPSATLEQLFEQKAAAELRAGNWSEGTHKGKRQYVASVSKVMIDTWGNTDCYSRSLADWELLQTAYIENGNKPATINKYMSECRAILEHAGKQAGENELTRLINLKDEEAGTAYTPEQTIELVKHAKEGRGNFPELEQAIIIAAYTGMRLNEVIGLKADDFIVKDGSVQGIVVRDTDRRTLKNKFSTRVVPTPVWPEGWQPNTTLFESMTDYRGDSSKFSTEYKRYIDRHLPHLRTDAEGKRLVFHSHRHAAITRCWRVFPVETAEATITPIMGHSFKSESGKTYRQAPSRLEDVQGLIEPVRLMNAAISGS